MNEKTKKRYQAEFKKALKSGKSLNEFINNCTNRHEISKIKNGIKHSSMTPEQKNEYIKMCEKVNQDKNKYRKKAEEQFKLRKVLNNINLLESKRLRLGFRLQLVSGLRVDEIANLTKEDITIEDDKLFVYVKDGKGGKSRKVECLEDDYVIKNLEKLENQANGKLFCTPNYIMKAAKKINFHSHDLRKTFAQIIWYRDDSKNKYHAVRNLQDRLGHAHNTSTYKKYLGRDINLSNTKWDI